MISIIIPVKPPEPYLPKLLIEIEKEVPQPHEVLIQTEKGLGYAVMCGIRRAKGEFVVVMDSDGSHSPHSIPIMVEYAKTYDIVVGSRYKGGLTYDSVIRQIISRVYCKFGQLLFGLHVRDNMSGFVVAKRQVFLDYPIKVKGYKFGLALLVASRRKLRAMEYPIVFCNRQAGKSKASPMEAVNTLRFMLGLFKGNN